MTKKQLDEAERRRVRITDEIRRAYEERDKSLDCTDPDCPTMTPNFWEGATIGRFYRPKAKKQGENPTSPAPRD